MSEASHQMTSNPLPKNGPRKPGSVGTAQGTVQVVVLDGDNKILSPGKVRSSKTIDSIDSLVGEILSSDRCGSIHILVSSFSGFVLCYDCIFMQRAHAMCRWARCASAGPT